jgi:hypothetical protein
LFGAGVVLVVLAGAQFAGAQRVRGAVGTQFEQCENGTSGVGDCTGSAWITGALNSNKALYREGDFVPFRVQITGLSAGTDYTLRIGYDAVENDLHGYDYPGVI